MEHIKWIFSGIGVNLISFFEKIVFRISKKEHNKVVIKKSDDVSIKENQNLDIKIKDSTNISVENNN